MPKLIPLALPKLIFPEFPNICTLFWVCMVWLNEAEPVIVDPFNPKVRLLLFENTVTGGTVYDAARAVEPAPVVV